MSTTESLRAERVGDVVELVPGGTLRGGGETDELQGELLGLIGRRERKILLNLEHATFVTSRGFGVLFGAQIEANEHGITLYVCNIPPRVQQVLESLKCLQVLNHFDDRDEALEALKKL